MDSRTFRLVILLSVAHALVHVFELSMPSVEREIATIYDDGKSEYTGWLSFWFRVPWGLGALFVGMLVDKFGARVMLTIYFVGCAACCFLISGQPSSDMLTCLMFVLGCFASIYHPAGLALLSLKTTPENRPHALGIHGVFGSAGIALAPLLVAVLLNYGLSWTVYFQVLGVVGIVAAIIFAGPCRGLLHYDPLESINKQDSTKADGGRNVPSPWTSFFIVTSIAGLMGLVYSGVLTFMKKYFTDMNAGDDDDLIRSSYFMAGALMLGCVGQYLAGKFARIDRLEKQLITITYANVPLLILMALAEGEWKFIAAGLFSLIHFMFQPIYNSLIPKYTPENRRSLCYGYNFVIGFGIGGLGAPLAGKIDDLVYTYYILAGVAMVSATIGIILIKINRNEVDHAPS